MDTPENLYHWIGGTYGGKRIVISVVTITNTVTVITMTANTVDRGGLQIKRVEMKESV